MKVGITCGGSGARASGAFIQASSRAAERSGFAWYWLPEHVLLFGAHPLSTHPYAYLSGADPSPERRVKDPRVAWSDPVVGMTWAAAATERIEIGSSIIILPQRNPVVLAKEIVTIDTFSGGRVCLGVGVGWCREEYEAIGADWPARGRRMDEHIAVLRALWNDDRSEFSGEAFHFADAYMYPKPVGRRSIPIIIGGESDAAITRVARHGDGWNAINLPPHEAAARIALLKARTREHGRDPASLRIIATVFPEAELADLQRYREAGVTEFNLLTGSIPSDPSALEGTIARLAEQFVEAVAQW